jgi:serine protease Do
MNYNHYQHDRPDPWEESSYRTGNTRPPKNHTGCIVVLLVLVILLGGIVSLLSLLSVQLFQKVTTGEQAGVGFAQEQEASAATDATSTPATEGLSITLDNSPEAVPNIPQAGGLSLQEIYTKAIDSVVSITCNTNTGTGVILHTEGYIVTNHHVVENASTIEVTLTNGDTYAARLIGSDRVTDLAVLQIDAPGLIPAEFGDSAVVQVGDAVVAIGDPMGIALRGTMTDGIISAINRDVTTGGRTMTLLQTNAALNPGNSGGPLLNCYGQVIGINTMKVGDGLDATGREGLGFAIPSATVKQIVDQLIGNGFVAGRPSIGIVGQMLSGFDQYYYKLPMGFYITEVLDRSDAKAQGIAPGDILLEFEGMPVTDADTLRNAIQSHAPGDQVTLKLYRNGQELTLTVTLYEEEQ